MVQKLNSAKIPTRKILVIALLMMFVASAFVVPQGVFAQETGRDPQIKVRMILDVLEGARSLAEQTLKKWEDQGLTIPQTSLDKLDEANSLAEQALQLFEEEKYEEAARTAIEAMKAYKAALRAAIRNVQDTEAIPEDQPPEYRAHGLREGIQRLLGYLERIEAAALKLQNAEHDTSSIDEAVATARAHLERAIELIGEGNVAEAAQEAGAARSIVGKLSGELHNAIKDNKPRRAEAFLSKSIEKLTEMEEDIVRLPLPPEAIEAIRVAFENARQRIAEARGLIQSGQVDDAIETLDNLGHDFRSGSNTLRGEKLGNAVEGGKALLNTIRNLESRLQFLGEGPESLKAKGLLNRAKSLLNDASDAFDNGDLNLARARFADAKELVDNIPSSLREARPRQTAQEPELLEIHAVLMAQLALVEEKVQDKPELQDPLEELRGLLTGAKEEIETGNEEAAKELMFEAFRLLQRLGASGLVIRPGPVVRPSDDFDAQPRVQDEVKAFIRMLDARISELEEQGVDVREFRELLQRAIQLLERSNLVEDDEGAQRAFREAMRILEKLNQALTQNDEPELTQIHGVLTEKVAALEREAQDKPDLLELLEKIKRLLADAREEIEAGNEEVAKELMFEAFRLLQGTAPKPTADVRRPTSLSAFPKYADVKSFLEAVQTKITTLEEQGVNVDKAKRFLQKATNLLQNIEAADDDKATLRALHKALQELQKVDRTLDKQLEKIGRSMFQMIHRLERTIEELEETDVDVSELKNSLQEIMNLLDEAKDNWHEGDFQEALNKMFEARALLLETTRVVKELLA